ncbi:MAG TPA: serine hydrolase domain-containing protein [Trebonia sp.]|nr:serine hydrolase domain-containing protein [Trebonia sp.]
MTSIKGAILLQRGAENLVEAAGGPTGAGPGGAGPGGAGPGAECTLTTRFQIASNTKQFTAAAVLLLAERGVLAVSDPVGRWFDGCPPAWDGITLHHLLTHSAGLPHWHHFQGLDPATPLPADEKLRLFAAAPLLSPPGERFSYSSPGFVLLAHVIENAARQSYKDFLAQEIFGPLGMTGTFDGAPAGRPDLASGHENGEPVRSFDLTTLGMGTGSIWSTVVDLTRWDRALADGEILSDASRRAMFTPHVPVEDDDDVIRVEGYGYGWSVGIAAGRRVIFHSGDNAGFRSFNAWFPDDDVRLAVLSNEFTTNVRLIACDLIRKAF